MTIQEQDIQLTYLDKFIDYFEDSLLMLVFAFFLVIGILIILSLPLILLFMFFYERVILNSYYKITGNVPKEPPQPFAELPIVVEFKDVRSNENYLEEIDEKYRFTIEFHDDEYGKIETDPPIPELQNKFFIYNTTVFKDKLFVHEIVFADNYRIYIGCIDCENLTYQVIKEIENDIEPTYERIADSLEITLRKKGMKKKIIIT